MIIVFDQSVVSDISSPAHISLFQVLDLALVLVTVRLTQQWK